MTGQIILFVLIAFLLALFAAVLLKGRLSGLMLMLAGIAVMLFAATVIKEFEMDSSLAAISGGGISLAGIIYQILFENKSKNHKRARKDKDLQD